MYFMLRYIFLIFFGGSFLFSFSQSITLENANSLKSGGRLGKNVQRLIGNVIMRQNNVLIYCDSAFLYKADNRFHGFGRVHVKQSGNTDIYGDQLMYDGNTKIGRYRNNVRLVDQNLTLNTNFLDFDLKDNSGTFYNGGSVQDTAFTLTCQRGNYMPDKNLYVFLQKVVVKNDKFDMYTDTLHYQRQESKAYFYGPTNIYGDSSHIYCERGWFNNISDQAEFRKNAVFKDQGRVIKAEKIFYDRAKDYTVAEKNVSMVDTLENVTITGNYATYNKTTEESLVTDSALMMQVYQNDTFYIHADTLRTGLDSSKQHKEIRGYHHAKIFSSQFQAKADSLFYSFKDSLVKLFRNPILWADENQITAEYIQIQMANRKPHSLDMEKSAFLSSKFDSIRFNQIKSRNMKGWFTDGNLTKIDALESCESIYFLDDEKVLVGVNKIQSQKMTISVEKNKVKRITCFTNPSGILYPPNELKDNDLILSGFQWFEEYRPLTVLEMFIWNKKGGEK